MITTDAIYNTLIASGSYEESVTGTLKDGSGATVLNISNEYIKTGSLIIDNKCINNDDLEPGAVYAAELKITITGNAGLTSSQKSSLQNGSLNLTYTITDGNSSSSIPIGIYYIIEVTLKDEDVEIIAEDMMSRLSKNIPTTVREDLNFVARTPYELLDLCCQNCSTSKRPISLANDETEFDTWSNADASFLIPVTADIATYRDLVAEVAKVMGCFATIDKNTNGLILKRLNPHSNSNVWNLNEDIRYRTEKSGYICKFGKVALGNESYPGTSDEDVSGLILNMRATELTDDSELLSGIVQNLYNEMAGISYRPCKIEFMGNIALEVGDWIGVNYTEDETTYTFRTIITHLNWILNGKELIESTGSSATTTKKVGSKGSNESRDSSSIDNLTNRIETLESSGGGNKIYTSTKIPTASDTANEGDLWYQMNYISSGGFDFPDWGYTLPLEYNPGSFKLAYVRSSLELRFYDTVNDFYIYILLLGGTNYTVSYNRLGLTNTFDGFDKDSGELQVTTTNEQGTDWPYWNYIPRWENTGSRSSIANPLGRGYSDDHMSRGVGTITYNLYSILGYARNISTGRYRLDGFRLISNGVETSWQYEGEKEYNIITRWIYKENNWQVADYIEGDGITINNGIISADSDAIVQITQTITDGTELATINGISIYSNTSNRLYISELAPTEEDNAIGGEGDLWYKVKRRGHFEGCVLKCVRAGIMTEPNMEFSVGQYVRVNYGNYWDNKAPCIKSVDESWAGIKYNNYISLSASGITNAYTNGNVRGLWGHMIDQTVFDSESLYEMQTLRLWTCNYDEERMITSNEVAAGGFWRTAVGYNIGFQGNYRQRWSTISIGGILTSVYYDAATSDEHMVDPAAVQATFDGLALFEIVDWGEGTNYNYDGTIIERMVRERYVKYDGVWVAADYKAGKGIIIDDGSISVDVNTSVDITQNVTSGTQLATINETPIYAPTVSATQTQTNGTEIGNITVGNTNTKLYAPTTTVTQTLTEGTEIAQVNGTSLYAPSSKIISHTTAEWESLGTTTVSESGVLYVYTDYKQDESGKNIPGFKMGDGNAYVADLPFSSAMFDMHMNNTDIHITAAEREKWNNKVSVLMNEPNNNLFFITG